MKRFKYLEHWKAFSDFLFWKDLDIEILDHPLLSMPCDGMPVRYVFDKSYDILVPKKIGVLCLCILVERSLFGTQMVLRWIKAQVLVLIVLMSI